MSIVLAVDCRENALATLLKLPNVISQQMDVGDFLFLQNGKPLLVVERKTYEDLAASIADGRYTEQKARMQQFECPNKAYLIEGSYPATEKIGYTRVTTKAIDSSLLGLAIRDGYQIIYSQGLDHTKELLLKIQKKLVDWPVQQAKERHYVEHIKVSKKDNMTPTNCYLAQLKQIPGVSTAIALAIQSKYLDLWSLMSAIQSGQADLPNLKVNNRRLGKTGQQILDYLGSRAAPKLTLKLKR
mgnify:CR=1 FL=1